VREWSEERGKGEEGDKKDEIEGREEKGISQLDRQNTRGRAIGRWR